MSKIITLDAVRSFLAKADDLNELLDVQRKVEAGQLYAKRSGLHEAQNELAEAKVRIDRRIGEITAAMEKSGGGRPQKNSSHDDKSFKAIQIREAGISIPQAHRLEKIASIPKEEFERHIAEKKEGGDEITQAGLLREARRSDPEKKAGRARAPSNSGENEWYTPPDIIEGARYVMGNIDLDPASSEVAQETIKANNYYTKEDRGLEKEWQGSVWLNPPIARGLTVSFIGKLLSSDFEQAMVLVNNATETPWGQKLLSEATVVCFLSGQVPSLDPQGNPGTLPQGQMLVGIRVDVSRFRDKFMDKGVILGTGTIQSQNFRPESQLEQSGNSNGSRGGNLSGERPRQASEHVPHLT